MSASGPSGPLVLYHVSMVNASFQRERMTLDVSDEVAGL